MNNTLTVTEAKFDLGTVLISPDAVSRLDKRDIAQALNRHEVGDYGLVVDECVKHNEVAIQSGFAIHSAYRSERGLLFLVVTDSERRCTTVLMPHELKRYARGKQPSKAMSKYLSEVPLGRIVATPGAVASVTAEEAAEALNRHMHGDWGDVSPQDWESNDAAFDEGERLLSSYRTDNGVKFWVITEADRSATTVLLPEEY